MAADDTLKRKVDPYDNLYTCERALENSPKGKRKRYNHVPVVNDSTVFPVREFSTLFIHKSEGGKWAILKTKLRGRGWNSGRHRNNVLWIERSICA